MFFYTEKLALKKINRKIYGTVGLSAVLMFFFFTPFWPLFDLLETFFASAEQEKKKIAKKWRGGGALFHFHFFKKPHDLASKTRKSPSKKCKKMQIIVENDVT